MSNSVQKSLVLYLFTFIVGLGILEFFYSAKSMHGPICQFPSFGPTNVHIFSTYNDNYQVNPVKAYAGAEARSSSWSHSSLDSIDASLAEHQVSVVPLVGSPISICVLLDGEKLCPNKLLELWNLHSCSGQLGHIKSR